MNKQKIQIIKNHTKYQFKVNPRKKREARNENY